MSQSTYDLLNQYDCYNCTERGGTIDVKVNIPNFYGLFFGVLSSILASIMSMSR